jgi:hypothetical protein
VVGEEAFIENNGTLLELIETQIAMHIAYVMTGNDDKQMRSYDSFFPALKNLHISTPNSFSRGGGSHDNLLGTETKFNLPFSLLNKCLAGNFSPHTYTPFSMS